MISKIVDREIISLNSLQVKMVTSGWGAEVIDNSVVEKITYLSDGLKVKGYLAYPKDSSKKYPCVIWNRGGAGNNGVIDGFNARGIFGQIASWGYVVFASQYRGNEGGEGKEELGGADVNDVLNLMPLADEISAAENKKWGIEGWSRGGMMAYLALLRNPNFKCAVLTGAISNLKQNSIDNPKMLMLYKKILGDEDLEKKLAERSITNHTNRLPKIPYLIMHGGNDEIISPLQSIEMSNKFYRLKIPYRIVVFEGGDHFLKTHRKEVDELRKIWYRRFLK